MMTLEEWKQMAEAYFASPDTMIQVADHGTEDWVMASERKNCEFNKLEFDKYRIAPQPKLRPRTREEWREFVDTEGSWLRSAHSGSDVQITRIDSSSLGIGEQEWTLDNVPKHFTKLDGSTLLVPETNYAN